MLAIEFQTVIHNGTIALPENYANWQDQIVRVILLATDKPTTKALTKRQAGSAKGIIKLADNFDAPLNDFCDYAP